MVPDITEQEARIALVNDQSDVAARPYRPKLLVLRLVELVETHARFAGLSCKSKAVILTAFCSSPVSRARLSTKVSAIRNSMASHLEHLHHLVAQVINHFHGNSPRLRLFNWP